MSDISPESPPPFDEDEIVIPKQVANLTEHDDLRKYSESLSRKV